jgi:hypothetical protein
VLELPRRLFEQTKRGDRVIGFYRLASCFNYRGAQAHFSHPKTAATPTKAALSSGLISFPFPGAVNVRNVDNIRAAVGIAG